MVVLAVAETARFGLRPFLTILELEHGAAIPADERAVDAALDDCPLGFFRVEYGLPCLRDDLRRLVTAEPVVKGLQFCGAQLVQSGGMELCLRHALLDGGELGRAGGSG
jgi:hypothetical protein